MHLTYKHTKYACYAGYITQAIINNLAPLLFIIFQTQYGLNFEMVGRLILIKECLRYGVDPFILDDKRRTAYYRGIARWDEDSSVLMETVLQAQSRFQNQMETCLLLEYCRPANPRKL